MATGSLQWLPEQESGYGRGFDLGELPPEKFLVELNRLGESSSAGTRFEVILGHRSIGIFADPCLECALTLGIERLGKWRLRQDRV